MSRMKKCIDHLGNEFESQKVMCNHWGVNEATFILRMQRGCSLEQSLTGSGIDSKTIKKKLSIDHLGNEFDSVEAMCSYWGINRSTFDGRLRLGYTLEQSLTGEGIDSKRDRKSCTDHTGMHFGSISEMCRYWGVSPSRYYARRKAGYTVEMSLIGNFNLAGRGRSKVVKDHLGVEHLSIVDMCKAWGIHTKTYENRRRLGYNLREALTMPIKQYSAGKGGRRAGSYVKDHLGNIYRTTRVMCEVYGINVDTYRSRVRSGWSVERALTTPVRTDD